MSSSVTPPRQLPDALARRRAAALAGHRGDTVTARGMLDDDDPSVRATAIGALDRIGDLSAAELQTALDDPSVGVRRRAIEVAATWPGDGPVRLLPLLDDPDASVVEVAAWACGERQPPEPEMVTRLSTIAISHDDALCREAAVAALGAISDPAGLPAILAATADRATVRRRAIIALAPFDGPEVDAALRAARTDRDWQVRQAAEDLAE